MSPISTNRITGSAIAKDLPYFYSHPKKKGLQARIIREERRESLWVQEGNYSLVRIFNPNIFEPDRNFQEIVAREKRDFKIVELDLGELTEDTSDLLCIELGSTDLLNHLKSDAPRSLAKKLLPEGISRNKPHLGRPYTFLGFIFEYTKKDFTTNLEIRNIDFKPHLILKLEDIPKKILHTKKPEVIESAEVSDKDKSPWETPLEIDKYESIFKNKAIKEININNSSFDHKVSWNAKLDKTIVSVISNESPTPLAFIEKVNPSYYSIYLLHKENEFYNLYELEKIVKVFLEDTCKAGDILTFDLIKNNGYRVNENNISVKRTAPKEVEIGILNARDDEYIPLFLEVISYFLDKSTHVSVVGNSEESEYSTDEDSYEMKLLKNILDEKFHDNISEIESSSDGIKVELYPLQKRV